MIYRKTRQEKTSFFGFKFTESLKNNSVFIYSIPKTGFKSALSQNWLFKYISKDLRAKFVTEIIENSVHHKYMF